MDLFQTIALIMFIGMLTYMMYGLNKIVNAAKKDAESL